MTNHIPLKHKLKSWQNYFIKDVYEQVKQVFSLIKIIGLEYSIVMYLEEDKKLKDYAWWFYFSQVNGTLVFKYRPIPNKKYIPDTVYIDYKDQLDNVVDLIIRTIDSRYHPITSLEVQAPKEDVPIQARRTHDNVFVPPTYENELYPKKQKDKIIERKLKKNR